MLKKLSILIVAGILVGCANIDNLGGKRDSGPIREISWRNGRRIERKY